MSVPAWTGWLERYVDGLVERGHIRTERVAEAFRRVPRHRCVGSFFADGRWVKVPCDDAAIPEDVLAHLYSDAALVTASPDDCLVSTATAPPVMAEMLEALELRGGERVLEIGTGTGYNAALLAQITRTGVVTVERWAEVANTARAGLERLGEDRVTVVAADGFGGYAAGGPYDRVIATVAGPGVAEAWMDQLALDGLVVAPVEVLGWHPVLRIERGRPFTADGRGVWWTDIAPGTGGLAHRVESHRPAPHLAPTEAGTGRAVRSFVPALDAATHGGLCAYVTVSNGGAAGWEPGDPDHDDDLDRDLGGCVVFGRGGVRTVVGRESIVVDGPERCADRFPEQVAEHFAEQFAKQGAEGVGGLADRWRRVGSPGFDEWGCELALERWPVGRFWRAYGWTAAGMPLEASTTTWAKLPDPAQRLQASEPPALGDAMLAWLAAAVTEACTAGLQSVVRYLVADLGATPTSSDRPSDDLGIGPMFDAVAGAVEENRDDTTAGTVGVQARTRTRTRATAEATGAPVWAATIAGHVAASIVGSPTNHPLPLAGSVLRVTGRTLEAEIERQRAAANQRDRARLTVRRILASDTFEPEMYTQLTDGLREEVQQLLCYLQSAERGAWVRFIAPDPARGATTIQGS